MNKLFDVLFRIGTLSGCHQMPERSFFYKENQFPVCARCTGAFIGYLAGAVSFIFFKAPLWLCIVLCAVMFLDWLIQRLSVAESTNLRRLITGILCGFGLMQIHLQAIILFVRLFIDRYTS